MSLEKDLRIGSLALSRGYVDEDLLRDVLARASSPDAEASLLDVLTEEGHLEREQRQALERALEREGRRPARRNGPADGSEQPRAAGPSVILSLRDRYNLEPPRIALTKQNEQFQDDEVREEAGRYQFGKELGKGGHGIVTLVHDTDIGRRVALKTLRSATKATGTELERFVEEVQVTGQLEHPNIVPVHELGALSNGEVFFTMKLVEGRTLEQIIAGLRKGNPSVRKAFNRNRMIGILQAVCQGVGFAHAKGVVHRDLKPANIMLGDYGEVLVMDWGLAKVRGVPDRRSSDLVPVTTDRSQRDGDETLAGTIKGTPAYMSPEQAMGRIDLIDERSDVYSIGVILYEMLCLQRPHMGRDPMKVIKAVVREPIAPLRERAPHMNIPEELEGITMRCLQKNPGKRYPTALAVHEELENFLEGTKRRQQAALRVQEGNRLAGRYEILRRESARLTQQHAEQSRGVSPWADIGQKRPVWEAEESAEAKETEAIDTFGASINRYVQALGYDPENLEAKRGLAALYWSKFREAEQVRDVKNMRYFRALVELYDDGSYAKYLKGDGLLSVDSQPRGARVELAVFEERDRKLAPVDTRDLGETPLEKVPVAMGSYRLTLSAEGMSPVIRPVYVGRRQHLLVRVQMYEPGAISDGFLFIPGGPFIMGGDPDALDAVERSQPHVGDFAIAELPVTMAQYQEFINHLVEADPMMAQFRVPRQPGGIDPIFTRGPDGKYFVPAFDRQNNMMNPQFPVFGISWEDAAAYLEWRSEQDGVTYRLPTDAEWEKAARGVDGRFYPWGDRFDFVFCLVNASRGGHPQPEPVGAIPSDCSPYGVRDMAGGVREWCADWFDETRELKVVRGGAWDLGAHATRVCNRSGAAVQDVDGNLGFRAVQELLPPVSGEQVAAPAPGPSAAVEAGARSGDGEPGEGE